jgi:hypothetical protein
MSRGLRLTPHNSSIEKVTLIRGIYRAAGFCLICLLSTGAYGQLCKQWKDAVRIGELELELREASGMAVSRQFPGRVYHINDSGDTGKFYITGMDGKDTRGVSVMGFDPQDTEALSLGPCGSNRRGSCLYLGDIGDNDANRKSIEVVVVDELKDFSQAVRPRIRLKLRYPDGPHDAESLAVHPNGTIFLLTKERPARLFKASPNVPQQTLVPVTTLDPGGKPTDMAISDDGTRLLVLTYTDAVEYSIDFKQQEKIRLNFLQQQESVAYLPGSRSFVYTTERLLPALPQWIMRVDCAQGGPTAKSPN